MHALVYTSNNQLTIEEHPIPQPTEHQALLRVEAAGVCGSDVDGFLGHSRKRRPPLVMGHEFVGRIVETEGSESDELYAVLPLSTCGQCRFCRDGRTNLCPERQLIGMDAPGAFAEYVVAPKSSLYPLGADLSIASAILAEPLANACHVVRLLEGNIPEHPVIIGFGAIGAVVMLALRHFGATSPIAIDTNELKLGRARELGAWAAFNASEPDLASLVMSAAGEVEVVVDCIGKGASRSLGIQLASASATLIWIGQNDGEMAGEARDITTRELVIRGSYAYTRQDFEQALELLRTQDELFSELVSFESLLAGQEVFERLVSDPGPAIKLALVPPHPGTTAGS